MNRFQALTGISVAGFIVLLGTNLKPILDALAGLPKVLQAFSQALPLGTGTFFLVLLLAGFAWFKLKQCGRSEAVSESAALAVALALTVALNAAMPAAAGMTPAASALKAVMLGVLAGLAAPYVFKLLAALWRWLVRSIIGEDGVPPCV